jgi:hypothetical protein
MAHDQGSCRLLPRFGQQLAAGATTRAAFPQSEDLLSDDVVVVVDGVLEAFESLALDSFAVSDVVDGPRPFADDVDERESVMYQPLPLNTMPTG